MFNSKEKLIEHSSLNEETHLSFQMLDLLENHTSSRITLQDVLLQKIAHELCTLNANIEYIIDYDIDGVRKSTEEEMQLQRNQALLSRIKK